MTVCALKGDVDIESLNKVSLLLVHLCNGV